MKNGLDSESACRLSVQRLSVCLFMSQDENTQKIYILVGVKYCLSHLMEAIFRI